LLRSSASAAARAGSRRAMTPTCWSSRTTSPRGQPWCAAASCDRSDLGGPADRAKPPWLTTTELIAPSDAASRGGLVLTLRPHPLLDKVNERVHRSGRARKPRHRRRTVPGHVGASGPRCGAGAAARWSAHSGRAHPPPPPVAGTPHEDRSTAASFWLDLRRNCARLGATWPSRRYVGARCRQAPVHRREAHCR